MATINFNIPTLEATISLGIGYYLLETVTRNGLVIPASHMEDAHKLEADGYVYLFEITLVDNSARLYLKMDNDVTWQGNSYQGTGVKITGVAQYADSEASRPTLMLFNPERVFSSLVEQGLLEGASVVRYKILKQHLDADLPVYRHQKWRITRVAGLRGDVITCEMRDMLDGQNFLVPGRMFIPPDFPTVSIS